MCSCADGDGGGGAGGAGGGGGGGGGGFECGEDEAGDAQTGDGGNDPEW